MLNSIINTHPTFLLEDKIAITTNNFLTCNELSYFQFLRCYKDGSFSLLTNDTSLFEYIANIKDQPVIFSSFQEEHLNLNSYWFSWNEELPIEPVSIAREKFKLYNGITLVNRTKNYYDLIGFARNNPCYKANSFYMNKIKILEDYFYKSILPNKNISQYLEKCRTLLPSINRDPNYKKICFDHKRIILKLSNKETYLTSQEIICLGFYLQNMSYKEIARNMGELSHRTVETYLNRLKERTGLTSKTELLQLITICK